MGGRIHQALMYLGLSLRVMAQNGSRVLEYMADVCHCLLQGRFWSPNTLVYCESCMTFISTPIVKTHGRTFKLWTTSMESEKSMIYALQRPSLFRS